MGVVYSYDEVCNAEVPKVNDHWNLASAVLTMARESDVFSAGATYGSTIQLLDRTPGPMTGAEIRRDVDMILFFRVGKLGLALTQLRQVTEEMRSSGNYARIEAHLDSDVPFVKPGQVDKQYAQHFARVIERHPEVVVGEPLRYIDMTPFTPTELLFSVRQFLSGKSNKFKGATLKNGLDCSDIQRALEAPIAITRKVMQPLGKYLVDSVPTEDKKGIYEAADTLITAATEILPVSQKHVTRYVRMNHDRLAALDREYSDLLQRTVESGADKDRSAYKGWLEKNRIGIIVAAAQLSEGWQSILESSEFVAE